MNLVFNKEMMAMPRRLMVDSGSIPYDFYESFGTRYGLFIPISASGYQFIRWIKKGMKDILPLKGIHAYLLHITNDGEVVSTIVDSGKDSVVMVPYTSSQFSMMSDAREITEAFNYLIKGCTNVHDAVSIIDNGDSKGLHDPFIFFVSDWVQHAREKGYDETFYHTRLRKFDL